MNPHVSSHTFIKTVVAASFSSFPASPGTMLRSTLCLVVTSLVVQTPGYEGTPTHKNSSDATIHVTVIKPSKYLYSALDECAEGAWINSTEEAVSQRREIFRGINQTNIDVLNSLADDPAGSLSQFQSCYELPIQYLFGRCVQSLEKTRADALYLKELEGAKIESTVTFVKNLDEFTRKLECALGERKAMELIDCFVAFFFVLKKT